MYVEKVRVNTTFTKTYLNFIDHLVKKGLYFNRGDVIMAGLRLLAKEYGISLLAEEGEG